MPWILILIVWTLASYGCAPAPESQQPAAQGGYANGLSWADDPSMGVRCYMWNYSNISCVHLSHIRHTKER